MSKEVGHFLAFETKSIDYSLNISNTEEDIMIRIIRSIILSYKHLISNYSIIFHIRVDILKYDH